LEKTLKLAIVPALYTFQVFQSFSCGLSIPIFTKNGVLDYLMKKRFHFGSGHALWFAKSMSTKTQPEKTWIME
jgi:hypothetical protein